MRGFEGAGLNLSLLVEHRSRLEIQIIAGGVRNALLSPPLSPSLTRRQAAKRALIAPRPSPTRLDKIKKNEYSFFMPKVSEEHRKDRRRQILMAAVACFSRRGFHKTRMQDICREAHLSPGAVYLYFKNKDAIIKALAETSRAANQAAWTRAAPDRANIPLEDIEGFLGKICDQRDPAVARMDVRFWGEAIEDPSLGQLFAATRKQFAEKFTAVFQSDLGCAPSEAKALADATIATIAGFQLIRAVAPKTDLQPAARAMLRALRGEMSVAKATKKSIGGSGKTRRRSTKAKGARKDMS